MSAPSSASISPSGAETLERAIAAIRAQLDLLHDRRRRDVGSLAASWQGGHRERFQAAFADIERRTRTVGESLAQVAVLHRRALDDELAR